LRSTRDALLVGRRQKIPKNANVHAKSRVKE